MFHAERLARYIKSLRYEDLPREVVKKAKQCVIDSIGCALAGSRFPAGKIIIRTMTSFDQGRESRIWGTARRSSILTAVFIHSALANVMDFDDAFYTGGFRSVIHPGASIIPPAFSLAQSRPVTGKRLLEAVVAAYEIQARIGEAVDPSEEQNKKIKGQGTFQTFGAMAATAKLFDLREEQIGNAFGIAGCGAPVAANRKVFGNEELGVTMVKNNYGMVSFNGLVSAFLAANGFTGPVNIFEGETGFWRMIGSDRFFPERLTKDLGKKYRILDVSFKPYPCGRYMHSSIDAVLKAVQTNVVDVKKIRSIAIKTHPFVANFLSRRNPKSYIHGTFSLPMIVGQEILKVPYGFEEQFRKNIRNREVLKYMQRVKVAAWVPEETNGEEKEYYPAEATLRTDQGAFSARVDYALGSRKNPVTMDQTKEKFLRITEGTLGKAKSRRVLEKLENLEKARNIRAEITDLLGSNGSGAGDERR